MDQKSYEKLVYELAPKEKKLRNFIYAFLSGGLVGAIAEFMSVKIVYIFSVSKDDAYICAGIIIVLISVILTGLGKMDNLVSKFRCGLIIPTTGFAHSVASCAVDYKKDGAITGLGTNFFKLAGSVILYGIVSSFFLVLLRVIIDG